jgi:hypothetical protein
MLIYFVVEYRYKRFDVEFHGVFEKHLKTGSQIIYHCQTEVYESSFGIESSINITKYKELESEGFFLQDPKHSSESLRKALNFYSNLRNKKYDGSYPINKFNKENRNSLNLKTNVAATC